MPFCIGYQCCRSDVVSRLGCMVSCLFGVWDGKNCNGGIGVSPWV